MVNLQQRSFKLHLFLLIYKLDYMRGEIISVQELIHNVKSQNYCFFCDSRVLYFQNFVMLNS